MNRNKEVSRELVFSAPQLIFLFLIIILLGVFIFILGVSVGKRQVSLSEQVNLTQKAPVETVKQKITPPAAQKSTIAEEIASHEKAQPKPQEQKTAAPSTTKAPPSTAVTPPKTAQPVKPQPKTPAQAEPGLFYIQLGAYDVKENAEAFADELKRNGFPAFVMDPYPTDRIPYYRLRVGGYATRDEAEKTVARLNTVFKKSLETWILKK